MAELKSLVPMMKFIFPDDKFILQSSNETGTLAIKNVPFGVGWWWESKK